MTVIFLTPQPGPVPEPPVDDHEFLTGFIRYGAWMRVIKAVAHVDTIKRSEVSDLQRLAAVTGLYEQAGFQAEDTITNLVAWSLWKIDRERRLADILDILVIRDGEPDSAVDPAHWQKVQRDFCASRTKRLQVRARSYLKGLPRDRS